MIHAYVTKSLVSSILGCLVPHRMVTLKMRLFQRCAFGCPMIFFDWPRLCVGPEAFWQRELLAYGDHLICLVARRVGEL